jgi:hypothetical protein
MSTTIDGSGWSYVALDSPPFDNIGLNLGFTQDSAESTEGWRNQNSLHCHYASQMNALAGVEEGTVGNQVALSDGTLFRLHWGTQTRIKRQITLAQPVYDTATATLGTSIDTYATLPIPLTHAVPVTRTCYQPVSGTVLTTDAPGSAAVSGIAVTIPTLPTAFLVNSPSGGTANYVRTGVALDLAYTQAVNLQIQVGSDPACVTRPLNGTGTYKSVDFSQNRYSLNPLLTLPADSGLWNINAYQCPLYLGITDSEAIVTNQGSGGMTLPVTGVSGSADAVTLNSVEIYFATPDNITDPSAITLAPVFSGGLLMGGSTSYYAASGGYYNSPYGSGSIQIFPPALFTYGSSVDLCSFGGIDAYAVGSSTPTSDVSSGVLAALASAGGTTVNTTLTIFLTHPVYPTVLRFYEPQIQYVYEASGGVNSYYLLTSTDNGATWSYAAEGAPIAGLANLVATTALLPSLMVEDDLLVIGWVENNGITGFLPRILVSADRGFSWH